MNHLTEPSQLRARVLRISGTLVTGALIGATLLSPVGAAAKEKALDVIVENDAANPVVVTGTVDATVTNTVPVTGTVDATVTNTVPVTGTVEVVGEVATTNQRRPFTCRISVDVPENTVGVTQSDACEGLSPDRQFVITQTSLSAFSIVDFPVGAAVDASVIFFHDGNSPSDTLLALSAVSGVGVDSNFLGFEATGRRQIRASEQVETWLHPGTYSARASIATNYASDNETSVAVYLSGYSIPAPSQ